MMVYLRTWCVSQEDGAEELALDAGNGVVDAGAEQAHYSHRDHVLAGCCCNAREQDFHDFSEHGALRQLSFACNIAVVK